MAKQTKSTKKTVSKKTTTPKNIENEKLVSILSYIIVGMIWYAVDENIRKSKLATFHVKQALNLLIIALVLSVVTSIIWVIIFILAFIPGIGWILGGIFGVLAFIVNIAVLVFWIFGLVYSINGVQKEIPIIGRFAEKYLKF